MIPLSPYARPVRLWLACLIALVATMVFVGGVTRLSESGLSIVEWKLFSGVFPPLTQDGWQKEFSAYQTSPEYKQKNFTFGVEEFKRIFWLEYIHRLLGRLVGIAFILPYLYFLARRALPKPLAKRMLAATLLVGAQGAVGWIMVKSGLIDAPRVSPLKLALHLSLALSLFSLLLWTFWQTRGRMRNGVATSRFHFLLRLMSWLLAIQIIFGALVAGNDAGLSYNTYPLMDGHFIPAQLGQAFAAGEPWYGNTLIVQFFHRSGAHLLCLFVAACLYYGARQPAPLRTASYWLAGAFALQFLLGILTLLHAVPLPLASAHQMAAMFLLTAVLNLRYLAVKSQA